MARLVVVLVTFGLVASVVCAQDSAAAASDEINSRLETLRGMEQFRNDYVAAGRMRLFLVEPYKEHKFVNVPRQARSDFEKGNDALLKGDYSKAKTRYQAAIAEYGDFALAHHNLGVAETNLKEVDLARVELQTAAKLEPEMTFAYRNLGLLELQQQNLPAAEPLLLAAYRLDPKNMKTLTLLAYTQALNKEYSAAIATARQVHELPKHEGYAFAHMVAATAFQSTGDANEAIKEYKQFITEDPQNPRVPTAKKALEELEAGNSKPADTKPK